MATAFRRFAATTSLFLLSIAALHAQQDRILNRVDKTRRVVLHGNVNPRARAEFDRGPLDDAVKMQGMMLLLKQSPNQQAALEQLLADQQNPASPQYHQWLTPEQYADRFGISQNDIDKVTAWLRSEGFTGDAVAHGRNWITFSGAAGQVRDSLGAELHRYVVNGETHFANATEPAIPAALQNVIGGIRGLNDFHPKPRLKPAPQYNRGSAHFLVPDDIATIYNISPLYKAGIDGAGMKIVVVGQTNIRMQDIQTFRSRLGLSAPDVQVVLVPKRPDPGFSSDDLPEADLDIEWTGGVARGASIVYVYSDDAGEAARYAIDQNYGKVISMSYGLCEQMDLVDLPANQSLAQQANSQGITWLAASGDAGAADCEDINSSIAQAGLAVDAPGVVPEITSVGGTEFNEGGGSYWSSSNSSTLSSALSYIPEVVWNDSSASFGLAAGGGGASSFFPKPTWQTGPGVPDSAFRLVPDVAFAASPGHDAFYVYTDGGVQYYGGTSVATPVFAGIITLLNHYLTSTGAQSAPGLGNINPALYHLAQNTSGVFHDIIAGDNAVPCNGGAPNCSSGSLGYRAGSGYDLASGLGSVDAANFVHQWSSKPPVDSAIVASIDQNPVYQQAPDKNGLEWRFNITLNEEAGVGTTLTSFTVDGADDTSQIASLFGGSKIPAHGSLTAFLGFKTLSVPKNVVFTFGGIDASGRQWTEQLSAPFASAQVQDFIGGVSNAASGQQVYAPGMIMSVYGVQMGLSPVVASATPLPTFLSGVSAYVNGAAAPLYYVSPTQLNVQIPYETQPGKATLEVDTPYQSATFSFTVSDVGPGIFVFPDGTANPYKNGSRGQTYTLFITGEGAVTPSVKTGSTPSPKAATPKPVQPVSVAIGGVTAPIEFIGIPSWSVGVTQINFMVPANAPLGKQQLIVTVGSASSAPAIFTVQ